MYYSLETCVNILYYRLEAKVFLQIVKRPYLTVGGKSGTTLDIAALPAPTSINLRSSLVETLHTHITAVYTMRHCIPS